MIALGCGAIRICVWVLRRPAIRFDTVTTIGNLPLSDRRIPQITIQDTPPVTPSITTQVYHRLSQEAYTSLERQLPQATVNQETTQHQLGYLLGIQYALKVIRDGFAVGS